MSLLPLFLSSYSLIFPSFLIAFLCLVPSPYPFFFYPGVKESSGEETIKVVWRQFTAISGIRTDSKNSKWSPCSHIGKMPHRICSITECHPSVLKGYLVSKRPTYQQSNMSIFCLFFVSSFYMSRLQLCHLKTYILVVFQYIYILYWALCSSIAIFVHIFALWNLLLVLVIALLSKWQDWFCGWHHLLSWMQWKWQKHTVWAWLYATTP